jgi:hypothetical protein
VLNRQVARSIHFLGLCWFVFFIIVHGVFVFITGLRQNTNHMFAGVESPVPRLNQGPQSCPHRRATARNGLPTHGGPSLILQSSRSMCRMAKKPEPPPTWNRLQDCR